MVEAGVNSTEKGSVIGKGGVVVDNVVNKTEGVKGLFKPEIIPPSKGGVVFKAGNGYCGNCGSFLIVEVMIVEPEPFSLIHAPKQPRKIEGKLFSHESICLRCGEYQQSGPYWKKEELTPIIDLGP